MPAGAPPKLPAVLWALLFGNFVIGTGIMLIPGNLNEISRSLGVGVATAGQLITAGSVLICLGAPAFAALLSRWDRRGLLALSMLWYGLFHLLCTFATDFYTLMVLRVLAVVPAAIFTPQAAACAGVLVPPEQRGRAITMIFLGWSVSSVLGSPLSAWVGGTLGWRTAFYGVATLSLVCAVWVWRAIPVGLAPPALGARAWKDIIESKALLLTLAVTVCASASQFVLFAYFAPYFKASFNASAGGLATIFMCFGIFGFIGSALMSRYIDRLGASNAVLIGLVCMATSLLLWPQGTGIWAACVVCIPWGLGCFATNSAQQARLVGLAPALASVSIALNTSAMYAGQAIGAASGGYGVANGRMQDLHWLGLVGMLCAIAVSEWARRAQPERAA
jgi:predicted MFS family arabinose efflux permease